MWSLGRGLSIITPDLQTRRLKPDTDLLTSRTWSQSVNHVSYEMSRVFFCVDVRERESKVQLFLHWEMQKARSGFCLIVAWLCNVGAETRCIQVIVWYSAVQCSTGLVIVSRGNIDPDPAVMHCTLHCTYCTPLQVSRTRRLT